LACSSSGRFCHASWTAFSSGIFSTTSGVRIGVVGTISIFAREIASGSLVMATRRVVFVLELGVLRLDQGLLIRGKLRLGGDHVQGRHGADFELLLLFLVKRLVDVDGGFFHFTFSGGVDEFPIIVGNLRDGLITC